MPIATAGAGALYRPGVDRLDYFARGLVAEDPTVARARFGYANELLRAGRDEDAVGELRAYLELSEDEGNAWGRLAEALPGWAAPTRPPTRTSRASTSR